jgi:AAA family ATP:ADP antiporter
LRTEIGENTRSPGEPAARRLLHRVVQVEDCEIRTLLWAFTAFFCLLSAYYVLRPVRETMGIRWGVENFPWLYTGTFAGTLATVPAWSFLVARWPRRVLVPAAYRFFISNLVILWGLFAWLPAGAQGPLAGVFFIWVSVFNLFAVSVFWSLMVDLFDAQRGRRLFGFVAGGGSLGALCGSLLTRELAEALGTIHLLWLPAVLLEMSVRGLKQVRASCARDLPPPEAGVLEPAGAEVPAGGSLGQSLWSLVTSPYLRRICAWFFLFSLSATFAYQEQGHIVRAAIADQDARTRFFADVNLAVQVLCFVAQAFLTGRLMTRFGLGLTMGLLSLIHVGGFLALGLTSALLVFSVFEILRRTAEYGIASPARQVLYAVVRTDEKYRTKNVIDVAVLRTSDVVTSWLFSYLNQSLGLSLSAIAYLVAPIGLLWFGLGYDLARRQRVQTGEGTRRA